MPSHEIAAGATIWLFAGYYRMLDLPPSIPLLAASRIKVTP